MLKYKSISSHILIHNIMHNDVMLNYGLMEKICLTTVCVLSLYHPIAILRFSSQLAHVTPVDPKDRYIGAPLGSTVIRLGAFNPFETLRFIPSTWITKKTNNPIFAGEFFNTKHLGFCFRGGTFMASVASTISSYCLQ